LDIFWLQLVDGLLDVLVPVCRGDVGLCVVNGDDFGGVVVLDGCQPAHFGFSDLLVATIIDGCRFDNMLYGLSRCLH